MRDGSLGRRRMLEAHKGESLVGLALPVLREVDLGHAAELAEVASQLAGIGAGWDSSDKDFELLRVRVFTSIVRIQGLLIREGRSYSTLFSAILVVLVLVVVVDV